jgi:hypothetical protein
VQLRAAVVQELVANSQGQRRRDDAEETNCVYDAAGAPRIQLAEFALGEDELRNKIV